MRCFKKRTSFLEKFSDGTQVQERKMAFTIFRPMLPPPLRHQLNLANRQLQLHPNNIHCYLVWEVQFFYSAIKTTYGKPVFSYPRIEKKQKYGIIFYSAEDNLGKIAVSCIKEKGYCCMDQTDWKILRFLSVGNSISKIAESLFISQPAVSYRIAKIEEEYKADLFIRTNRGITLTDAGKRLCSYSMRMLALEEEIRLSVARKTNEVSGHIVVGSVSSFACNDLASQLIAFQNIYSNISVDIEISHSPGLIQRLRNNDMPMVIIRGRSFDEWTGECFEISSEMAVVVANEPITRDYIASTPCLNMKAYKPGAHTAQNQEIAEEWAIQMTGKLPLNPKIRIINGDSKALIQFVKRDFGWAVVTSSKLQESDGLYNKVIYDSNGEPFLYKTCLLYRKDILELDAYQAFLEHFRNYFARRDTLV